MIRPAFADILVVGGGPAGAASAMLLARAGYAVTLIERRDFPRAKPCGDCLSPGANAILERLGVWDDVLKTAPAVLAGWQLFSPAGHAFQASFDMPALAVPRDRLDAVLLEHARAAGVRVMIAHVVDVARTAAGRVTGVRVRAAEGTRTVTARLTIGADGLRSVIARRLQAHSRAPRLRKASFTVHAPLDLPASLGQMHVLPDGCLGIAPVESGSAARLHNITLVLKHGSVAGARVMRTRMAQTLYERTGMRADFTNAELLTSGPFAWPVRRVAFAGAALVGDAAGYYDPFTGQGIYQALRGAELLAEHAGRSIQLPGYAAALGRLQHSTHRLQQLVEFVCARPRLADRAFRHLARNHALAQALVSVTGDVATPAHLLSPRMLMSLTR